MNTDLIAAIVHQETTGPELLDRALRETELLDRHRGLTRILGADMAPAASAWSQHLVKATRKWTHLRRPFFTERALQQGTSTAVGTWRAREAARRLGPAASGEWVDLGCGAGGDWSAWQTEAADSPATRWTAIERDPVLAACARANGARIVEPRAGRASVLELDATGWLAQHGPEPALVFADPDRRAADGARHARSLADVQPDPQTLLRVGERAGGRLVVKAAPALEDLDGLGGLDPERSWVSLDGETRECTLWCGPLRRASRSAVALPSGQAITREQEEEPRVELGLPEDGCLLGLPDPAVRAARMESDLAAALGARRVRGGPGLLILPDTGVGALPPGAGTLWRRYRLVELWPDARGEVRRRLRDLQRRDGAAIVKRWRVGRHGQDVQHLLEKLGRSPSRSSSPTLLLDTQVDGRPRLLELLPADTAADEGLG